MPELPDVEGARRALERHHGAAVTGVRVTDPEVVRNASADDVHAALVDEHLGGARRHGKWLGIDIDRSTLVVHLGMTGALHFETTTRMPASTERLAIELDGDVEVRLDDRRRLATVWLCAVTTPLREIAGELGPDALQITAAQLRTALGTGRRPIKTALMDQHRISGLGNMSSDEVLWRAGLNPRMPAGALDPLAVDRLRRTLRTTMASAARAGHLPRTGRWLTGQRDRPDPCCPRCRHPLARGSVGGRTSLWCPHCQPDAGDAPPGTER